MTNLACRGIGAFVRTVRVGAFAALAAAALLAAAPSPSRAQGLPPEALTQARMVTVTQDVQAIIFQARLWYRDALLAAEQCDKGRFDADMAALEGYRRQLHQIEMDATELRDEMRQREADILRGLSDLIPSVDNPAWDTGKALGLEAAEGIATAILQEGAGELAESLAGPAFFGADLIGKIKEYEEKLKVDASRQEILRLAVEQETYIQLVNLTIKGAQDAQRELQGDADSLRDAWAARKCDDEHRTATGGGVTDGGSSTTGGVTVKPGDQVAKNTVKITDSSTQRNIPGGKIVVIPEDPKQPVRQTDINPGGSTTIPQHGPNDVVEVLGTCHQKIDLTGKAFDGPKGVDISTPPHPLQLVFSDATCGQVTDKMVDQALRGQYGVSLPNAPPITWGGTDIGGMCYILVYRYTPVRQAAAAATQPQQCPATTTGGGGGPGTTRPGGGPSTTGGGPGTTDGGGGTITDGPTTTDGGHVVEGEIPREELGPAPNDPLARSKGSWGQPYADQWWLGAIDWLKSDGTTVLPATGSRVIVAVIDTGVDLSHPDLYGAAWLNPAMLKKPDKLQKDKTGYTSDLNGWNFIDNNADVTDKNGHGTVVAGIIAAMSGKGFGIAGIDPWAKIMALKALEVDGKGGSANVSRAILYAVDHGARVINLSVGGKRLSVAEQKALDYAAAKNVVVVAASGNDGVDTAGFSPAGLRHVLTVAAVDPELKRPTFSNWGANVAIAAPGVDILSLRARQTDLLIFTRKDYKPGTAVVKGSYYRVTGSSFAAPMVSGAAALLLSIRPQLSAEQVVRILEQSARNLSGIGNDQFTGYGLLDIDAALKADPNAYVDAAIAGVDVAQASGRTVVRVNGTAASDQLKEAYIEIGQGDAPTSWKRVSRAISASVNNGVLDDLDPSVFAGGKEWTLRVIAVSRSGKQREARYKLSLG
jgi:subtilisin family serine protease